MSQIAVVLVSIVELRQLYTRAADQNCPDHGEIAAANIVWGAGKTWLPTDVTNGIDIALSETGMPRIATRNVSKGMLCCLMILELRWPSQA